MRPCQVKSSTAVMMDRSPSESTVSKRLVVRMIPDTRSKRQLDEPRKARLSVVGRCFRLETWYRVAPTHVTLNSYYHYSTVVRLECG